MSHHALADFADMNGHDSHHLYFDMIQGSSNALERAYVDMVNRDLSTESISTEFFQSRVPLPFIVGLGNVDLAKHLINKGIDVNIPTNRDYRALHMACCKGNAKMAELLLENRADANAMDGLDRTPMMSLFIGFHASWFTDIDECYRITRLLVSYGAKLGPADMDTLSYAIQEANLDTLKLLVNEANGKLSFRSSEDENSCLHLAVVNKQPGVLEYVLGVFEKENMDIDLPNYCGETPLLIASQPAVENYRAVKMLLKSGADFNTKADQGLTSFELLMRSRRNPELAWFYFDLGFDLLGRHVSSLYLSVKWDSPWMEDIVAEIARKETMGERTVGMNQQVFNKYRAPRSLRRRCKEQLRETQNTKFYKDVSFWDVLSADKNKLRKYAENLELVKAFFDAKCKGAFPIYCARIRHRFFEVLSRNSLIDLSTSVVCKMTKLSRLYEIMQHEIMTYMKDEDFVKILGCCDKA